MEFARESGFLEELALEKEAARELVLGMVFFLYCGLHGSHKFMHCVKLKNIKYQV